MSLCPWRQSDQNATKGNAVSFGILPIRHTTVYLLVKSPEKIVLRNYISVVRRKKTPYVYPLRKAFIGVNFKSLNVKTENRVSLRERDI
jgi:hypothetical protein